MSYTPTVWNTGDVITAEKLNHAEEGIKNAFSPYVVNFTVNGDVVTCDKTYQEIVGAYSRNVCIAIANVDGAFELHTVFTMESDEATNKRYCAFKQLLTFEDPDNGDKVVQLTAHVLKIFEDGTAAYTSADTYFE